MDKILEKEIRVGSEQSLTITLPPGIANTLVKVTVEVEPHTEPTGPLSVPSLEEIMSWPVRHEHPTVFLGRGKVPREVFEPMGEEELGDWENAPL